MYCSFAINAEWLVFPLSQTQKELSTFELHFSGFVLSSTSFCLFVSWIITALNH
jgi:hypothetical protein